MLERYHKTYDNVLDESSKEPHTPPGRLGYRSIQRTVAEVELLGDDVHAFDPREGGSFRISLTYDAPTRTGKTTAKAAGNCYSSFLSVTAPILDSTARSIRTRDAARQGVRRASPRAMQDGVASVQGTPHRREGGRRVRRRTSGPG